MQNLVEEKTLEEKLGHPVVVYPQRKSQGIINIDSIILPEFEFCKM